MEHSLIDLYRNSIGCSINDLVEEIFELIKKSSRHIKIIYRIKDTKTLTMKMALKKAHSIFEVNDVYGIRILVTKVEYVWEVFETIQKTIPCVMEHDYIRSPKTRPDDPSLAGKSLRLLQLVGYKNNTPFEIQITTFKFNVANELLHNKYHCRKYNVS